MILIEINAYVFCVMVGLSASWFLIFFRWMFESFESNNKIDRLNKEIKRLEDLNDSKLLNMIQVKK
jgi:hypothetical protein